MRFYQYIPMLEKHGIIIDVEPLLDNRYLERQYSNLSTDWIGVAYSYAKRAFKLFRSLECDLIWIEKEVFPNMPALVERIFNLMGIKYVVDYDDATFHRYDEYHGIRRIILSSKIDNVMRLSSLVICGNSYLADRAYNAGAQWVELLPTVVDIDRYKIKKNTKSNYIVIGWIGSPSTVHYLDIIAPALRKLSESNSIQLRVVGANYIASGIDVVCKEWSEETEVSEMQNFDIGIMPLTDNKWEKGKCGYKLIQCMACAKPVVASPVGVNVEIVKHGENGYLASTEDEWIDALQDLCNDVIKRNKMGMNGRSTVEHEYSLQSAGTRLIRLLYDAAENVSNGKL